VWQHGTLTLTVTAFASGEPHHSTLWARYRVENRGERGLPVALFLAVRPFQVNPPWQTLNTTGGVAHIQDLSFDGRAVRVNQDRVVVPRPPPDRFGASPFEEGSVTDTLAAGRVPPQLAVSDPIGFASGALQYNLYLKPNAHADVAVAVPLHEARANDVPL